MTQMNLFMKQKQTHRHSKQMYSYQGEKWWGRDKLGIWDYQIQTTYLLCLLSRFSCARLCATPETAAHQAPPSLGFSRQEHWSGLPFLYPMHKSEKWKWSRSVVSDSLRPHGLQPTRLLRPWDFPRVLEWGAIAFSNLLCLPTYKVDKQQDPTV